MYFANPWGLLGLLSLPVITAIHLFQRRFPPLLVAGTHLWGAETRVQMAGRRRDRLPVTASLLLELLAGLIFSLALAQPRFGELGSVAHLVVVLDDSASMSGQPASEPSFRRRAIAVIQERLEALERDARVTLIRSGVQPTLLGQQAMNWNEAETVLADWHPQAPGHDFSPAWDEAARIVGDDGAFLFVTDRIDDRTSTLPLGMDVVSVGQRLINVAISSARWDFDSQSGSGRLFVRLSNYSSSPTTVTLTASSNGQELLTQPVSLPARGTAPLEASIPGGVGRLTVRVAAPQDGLVVDDTVTLVEPKVRLLTVAVTLPEETPALRVTDRALAAVPDVQRGDVAAAHLLIGPASEPPPERPGLWWFGIGPLNPSPVIRKQARDLLGPYLIEKQHPLLSSIVLGGVVWGGVQPTDLPLRPLISSGRVPLLGQRLDTTATAYLMNIDFARSNLGESPDWPILMTNLLELRRDELPGLRLWNYHVNELIVFRAPPTDERAGAGLESDLKLVSPSGNERPLVRDRNDVVEITRLHEAGVYRIEEASEPVGEFAVNFLDDEESSSVMALAPGRREARSEAVSARLSLDDPYSWLMVIAILLLLAAIFSDWYVLRPRGRM